MTLVDKSQPSRKSRAGESMLQADRGWGQCPAILNECGHPGKESYGRVKHFFSIYKKMVNQKNKTTRPDLRSVCGAYFIVDSVKDCYAALGVIHEMYTPIPGRI